MVFNHFNNYLQPVYVLNNYLQPGAYSLLLDRSKNDTQTYYMCVYLGNRLGTSEKLYGEHNTFVNYVWRNIKNNGYRGNLLVTGMKGSGKSELCSHLSNFAINDGMRVLLINKIDSDLINYLESLDNFVFFFDEFSKNIGYDGQHTLLTFLTNIFNKKRVCLLTENSIHSVSTYLLNRPGRIRYFLNMGKLPVSTLEEYCLDRNIPYDVILEIYEIYNNSQIFTFDHLRTIVDEYLNNKMYSIKDIIKYLNIQVSIDGYYILENVYTNDKSVNIVGFYNSPELLDANSVDIYGSVDTYKHIIYLLLQIQNTPNPDRIYEYSVYLSDSEMEKSDDKEILYSTTIYIENSRIDVYMVFRKYESKTANEKVKENRLRYEEIKRKINTIQRG